MLTGEGSDELFAGYERYRFYQWNQQMADELQVCSRAVTKLDPAVRSRPLTCCRADLRRKLQHTFVGLRGHRSSRCTSTTSIPVFRKPSSTVWD